MHFWDPELVIFTSLIFLRPKSVLMMLSFLAWARIVFAHTRGIQNFLFLPQLSFWDRSWSWWSCLSLPGPGLYSPTPGGPRTSYFYLNYPSETEVGLDEVVFPCLSQDSVWPTPGGPRTSYFYLNYHSETEVSLDEVVLPCLSQDSVGPHQGDPEFVIFTSIINLRHKSRSVMVKLSFLAWARIVLAHTRGTQNLLYLPQLSIWDISRSWWSCLSLPGPG